MPWGLAGFGVEIREATGERAMICLVLVLENIPLSHYLLLKIQAGLLEVAQEAWKFLPLCLFLASLI